MVPRLSVHKQNVGVDAWGEPSLVPRPATPSCNIKNWEWPGDEARESLLAKYNNNLVYYILYVFQPVNEAKPSTG